MVRDVRSNTIERELNEKLAMSNLDEFLAMLQRQAVEKAKLYDGAETFTGFAQRENIVPSSQVDFGVRLAAEELGEIASAITRNRRSLARAECIDLAHCAFLLWVVLGEKEA